MVESERELRTNTSAIVPLTFPFSTPLSLFHGQNAGTVEDDIIDGGNNEG